MVSRAMVVRVVALVVAAVVAALVLVLISARPVVGPGPTPLPAVSSPAISSAATGAATPAQATPAATSALATPRVDATAMPATPASGTPAAGATSTPSAGATATASANATPSAGATPSPSAATGIPVDPSLLDILPPTVDGSTVVADTNRETDTATDTTLATYVQALAAATVGDNGENIATIILVERRPEVAMDDWFPRYRADFDSAACDPIGGPGSTSTRTLAGREVQVTSCKDGGIVYHVIVRGGTTIVSVFELGPKEFGRVLLENLAPGA